MKTAIIADVHANLVALEAVIADLEKEQPDQVVCLGDVASFGPQPRAALRRVQSLGCPVVMGNADAEVLDPQGIPPSPDAHIIEDISRWCAAQYSSEDLDFIRSFQPIVQVPLGGDATLLCFHGSPRDFNEIIVATTPDEKLDEMITGHRATVMAGGHTHVQMVRRYKGSFIINPGSVGLPYEWPWDGSPARNPPWAEYAVVNWNDGRVGIDLRRVPVNIAKVVDVIRASGMPHAEMLAADWR